MASPPPVTRKVGKGSITYIGASLEAPAMKQAAAWMLQQAGLTALLPGIPEGVDVAIRSGDSKRILILTNYAASAQSVHLPSAMTDLLAGGSISDVTLPQYGVAVLQFR